MKYITRFAPAPTGHLHLGHVLHFLYVQKTAEKYNARILQRLEDHDSLRSRSEFAKSITDDLDFLGLADPHLWTYQNQRKGRYLDILVQLARNELLYKCSCSRTLIRDRCGNVYDGHCRKNLLTENDINFLNDFFAVNETGLQRKIKPEPLDWQIRLKTENRIILFKDEIKGNFKGNPETDHGDFPLMDRYLNFTYQFCVAADDLDSGVNLIIRGSDLLDSVPRQLYLRELILKYAPPSDPPPLSAPIWYHHNLILDEDGKKLSKRYRSSTVRDLRKEGLTREEIKALAMQYFMSY